MYIYDKISISLNYFTIRVFRDRDADLFKTHILYSGTFFRNWYM
jgi:hypothetical protein